MKRGPHPVVVAVAALAVTSCASSTVIQSNPPGSKIYLNGIPVGTTPYRMKDRKITGSTTEVRLEHPGYEPLVARISRTEELDGLALVGGLFLLVPFLWIMEYQDSHYYELRPARASRGPSQPQPAESEEDVQAQVRRANELNAEGRDLVRAGEYAEAIEKFEQAAALFADPRFFFNLCVALDAAGRAAEAIEACEAVYDHQPSDRLRAKTDELLERLRSPR